MTLNSFAYAGISPSNRVDEDGRFWEELFEGVGLFSSCVAGAGLASTAIGTEALAAGGILGDPVGGAVAAAAVPVLGCVGGIALAYYGYEVALDVPTYY